MDITRSEKVTKKDAARRQLQAAVRLFFVEEDSIAIHTIAGAAHELLRTLVKRHGGSSLLPTVISFARRGGKSGSAL